MFILPGTNSKLQVPQKIVPNVSGLTVGNKPCLVRVYNSKDSKNCKVAAMTGCFLGHKDAFLISIVNIQLA